MSPWINRAQWESFAQEKTTAHRLVSTHSAWIERLGNDLLLSYKHETARDTLREELTHWCHAHEWSYHRLFHKYLPLKPDERTAPTLWEGEASLPLQTTVQERGTAFHLDFSAGYSIGLAFIVI